MTIKNWLTEEVKIVLKCGTYTICEDMLPPHASNSYMCSKGWFHFVIHSMDNMYINQHDGDSRLLSSDAFSSTKQSIFLLYKSQNRCISEVIENCRSIDFEGQALKTLPPIFPSHPYVLDPCNSSFHPEELTNMNGTSVLLQPIFVLTEIHASQPSAPLGHTSLHDSHLPSQICSLCLFHKSWHERQHNLRCFPLTAASCQSHSSSFLTALSLEEMVNTPLCNNIIARQVLLLDKICSGLDGALEARRNHIRKASHEDYKDEPLSPYEDYSLGATIAHQREVIQKESCVDDWEVADKEDKNAIERMKKLRCVRRSQRKSKMLMPLTSKSSISHLSTLPKDVDFVPYSPSSPRSSLRAKTNDSAVTTFEESFLTDTPREKRNVLNKCSFQLNVVKRFFKRRLSVHQARPYLLASLNALRDPSNLPLIEKGQSEGLSINNHSESSFKKYRVKSQDSSSVHLTDIDFSSNPRKKALLKFQMKPVKLKMSSSSRIIGVRLGTTAFVGALDGVFAAAVAVSNTLRKHKEMKDAGETLTKRKAATDLAKSAIAGGIAGMGAVTIGTATNTAAQALINSNSLLSSIATEITKLPTGVIALAAIGTGCTALDAYRLFKKRISKREFGRRLIRNGLGIGVLALCALLPGFAAIPLSLALACIDGYCSLSSRLSEWIIPYSSSEIIDAQEERLEQLRNASSHLLGFSDRDWKSLSISEIKTAFRKLVLTVHPDKGGDQELFKALTVAFAVLTESKVQAQFKSGILADGEVRDPAGLFGESFRMIHDLERKK